MMLSLHAQPWQLGTVQCAVPRGTPGRVASVQEGTCMVVKLSFCTTTLVLLFNQ